MIETHWKCPGEPPNFFWKRYSNFKKQYFQSENRLEILPKCHGRQVTEDMQLPILESKMLIEILNFLKICPQNRNLDTSKYIILTLFKN